MRNARSNAWAVTSSAALRSRSSVTTYAYTSSRALAVERVEVEGGRRGGVGGSSVALIVLDTPVLRRAGRSITTLPRRYRFFGMRAVRSQHVSPPAAALLAPAARRPRAPAGADRLWATVNVCDTTKHPNEVGIRASMPGTPRGAARRMRFRVQWRDGDRWRYVAGADSGWRKLSRSRGRAIESGWSFEFEPPAKAITFRGVVRFRWLRDGRDDRPRGRDHRGRPPLHGGRRPGGYSAATCSIA